VAHFAMCDALHGAVLVLADVRLATNLCGTANAALHLCGCNSRNHCSGAHHSSGSWLTFLLTVPLDRWLRKPRGKGSGVFFQHCELTWDCLSLPLPAALPRHCRVRHDGCLWRTCMQAPGTAEVAQVLCFGQPPI
jgi:hypothetical protein